MAGQKHSHIASLVILSLLLLHSGTMKGNGENFDEPWRLTCFTTTSGLPSNSIHDLIETPSGTIWVSTTKGMAYYDHYSWTVIDSGKGLPLSHPIWMSNGDNDSIFLILDKRIYYGNQNGFRKLPISGAWSIANLGEHRYMMYLNNSLYTYKNGLLTLYERAPEIVNGNVLGLYQSRSRSIFVNTFRGLYRYVDGTWKRILEAAVPSLQISGIVENNNGAGALAVGMPYDRRGLWEWHGKKGMEESPEFPEGGIQGVDIGPRGELLILLRSGELKFRNGGTWTSIHPFPVDVNNIESVKFRDNGDIWFCTGQGLYLYKRSSRRWRSVKDPYHAELNIIDEILRTHDGAVWLGTEGGIEILKADGSLKVIEKAAGIPLKIITGLGEDREGNVWVSSGATFDGAIRWNGKSWKHYPVSVEPKGLRIHKIRTDLKGNLWFLGMSNAEANETGYQPGAFMYDGTRFTPWSEKQGLLDGRVQAFAEGPDSALWFGTYLGISRFKREKWDYWKIPHGAQQEHIFTLAVDHKNRLWFADRQNGLGYIDVDDSAHKISNSDGLPNDNVWDLKIDPHGRLWLSTQGGGGLCCYDNGVWMTFDSKSGLTSSSLWPVLPLADEVLVGTIGQGLAVLRLNEIDYHSSRIDLDLPVVEEGRVKLQWDCFSYWGEIPPLDILTRYRIDQRQWSEWSTVRRVLVENVSVGTHSLSVQAQDFLGRPDPVSRFFSFTVPRPFYQSIGFIIPVYGSCLLMIALVVQYVVRRRKHATALRLSEIKFRRLSEATFEGIIIHEKGTIRDVNESICRILGFPSEYLIGKPLLDFIARESHDLVTDYMASGNELPVEAIAMTSLGNRLAVEIIQKRISYQERIANVVAMRDITERKAAEEKLLAYQEQLRRLALALASSEERERKRMATFLHDEIIQSLAFCQMKLSELKSHEATQVTDHFFREIDSLIEQAIENAQSLTFELSPPILHVLGLAEALGWLCETFQERHHLNISLTDDGRKKNLDEGSQLVLFNAVRETLVNVVKHARATRVTMACRIVQQNVIVAVEDDGAGFDVSILNHNGKRQGGFGLFNMQERLQQLGGSCTIDSSRGKGTRITLAAPLQRPTTEYEDAR